MARHCLASVAPCLLFCVVLVLGTPAGLRESTADKGFAQLADFVSEFTDISVASLRPFSAQKLFGCIAKDKLKALNDHCTCCLVQDSKIPPIPDVAACMLSKSGTFDLSTGLLQSDKLVADLIGESSLSTGKKASATSMYTNCLSSSLNDMILPKRFLQSIPLESSSAPLQNPEVPTKNMTAFRAILCAAKSLNANGCDQRLPLKTEQKQRVARQVSVTSETNVNPKDKNNITQTVQKNETDTGRILFIGGKKKKKIHTVTITDIDKSFENITTILSPLGSSETRKIRHHTHNNTIEHDNKYVDFVENGTDGSGNSSTGDSSGSQGGSTNSDGSIISKNSLNGGSANNGGGMSSGGGTNNGGSMNGGGTSNGGSMNGSGTSIGGSTNSGGTSNGGFISGGGTNNGGSINSGGGKINGGSDNGGGSTFRNPLNGMENNGNTGNNRLVVAPSTRRPTPRASIAPKIEGNNLANAGFGFVFGPKFGKK